MNASLVRRTIYFFLFCILSLLLFRGAVAALAGLAWTDNRYTHILVVPFLSLGLALLERRRVFSDPQSSVGFGAPLIVFGVAAHFAARFWPGPLGEYGTLTLEATAIVLSWIGGFLLFYGPRCGRACLFPLALLVLAIPIPPAMVEVIEVALQKCSAEVAHLMFKITATPVYRDGMVFSLPGLNVEVARECSGIRSSIALLITALVLGYLFLRSGWSRLTLAAATVPIAIAKNAFRITSLSWLGAFVSEDIIHSSLHHRGGPIYAVISLVMLLPVLWALRRGEADRS
jgi:exosortase